MDGTKVGFELGVLEGIKVAICETENASGLTDKSFLWPQMQVSNKIGVS